jgi:hypothetical protein
MKPSSGRAAQPIHSIFNSVPEIYEFVNLEYILII